MGRSSQLGRGAASPASSEPFSLTLAGSLHDLSLAASGRLLLNATTLLATPLASLSSPPCLLQPLLSASSLQSLNFSAHSLDLEAVGNDWGRLRPQSVLPSLATASLIPPLRDLALPAATSPYVSGLATALVRGVLDHAHTAGCPLPPPAPPRYANLSAWPPLRKLAQEAEALTDDELDQAVRRLIRSVHRLWTRITGHNVPWADGHLPLPPLSFALHDAKLGDVRVNLANTSVDGLDGLYAIGLRTHAEAPALVTSRVGLGNSSERPLRISTVLHLQLDGKWHAHALNASLHRVRVEAGALVEIDETLLSRLTCNSNI